jgi:anaerobic magnesium-protoporphyrin IX monomethyl ester cyclase
MTQVLFGQSYFLRFDPKLWDAMQPYPPLGTLYAASYLRGRGYGVDLFDAMIATSEDEWAAALDRSRPRYAVLYEDNFNYLSKMCLLRMRQAAFTMTEMARQRGVRVIICGSDATDHAAEYLSRGADFILLGEGEETLGELMDRLTGRTGTPLADIKGLVHKGEGWESAGAGAPVIHNPRRPDLKALDELPFPAWDLIDVPSYQRLWRERHGYYAVNMVTTRGCPYHCNWCAKPIWGQRYHARSPENVVEELRWLKQRYQPDKLWFADDIVGLKPGWWARFADLVEQHNCKLPFKALSRADLLLRNDRDIESLARAGCEIMWMGAESGSQKVLDAMEKGTTVEQIREAAHKLHAAGVKVAFFLQFGYPGETREDIEKTLQMVRDCRPDDIGISVSYPLPKTRFYERVKSQLGDKQNWVDSSDLDMMYQGPFSTEFYRKLHTVVHKEFRARKTWDELLGLAKNPLELPSRLGRGHLRQTAAMLYNVATLPLERYRLDALARVPHRGLAGLSAGMSQRAAAEPSPQAD